MKCKVFRIEVALLLTMAPGAFSFQHGKRQQNPFEEPLLYVRPRVFIRRDAFEGLTVTKLREVAKRPEFAAIRAKWRSRPLGQAIEWMVTEDRDRLIAATAGLKEMQVTGSSWTYRGQALVKLATLFDWLYEELDPSMRAEIIARIEHAADGAVEHIREGRAPFFYTRTPGALAGLVISAIQIRSVGGPQRSVWFLRLSGGSVSPQLHLDQCRPVHRSSGP